MARKKNKNKTIGKKDKSLKKDRKKHLALHTETKKGILVVTFFALAVLSILSFVGAAGVFGEYFFKFSRFLFGRGFFLVTVSFILAAVAILAPRLNLKERKKPEYTTLTIGIFLFMFSLLGLFHSVASWVWSNAEVVENSQLGGGYLGFLIGYFLIKYLGVLASIVILLSFLIISILVTFNLPLRNPFKKDSESDQEESSQESLPAKAKSKALSLKKPSALAFWKKGKSENSFPDKEKGAPEGATIKFGGQEDDDGKNSAKEDKAKAVASKDPAATLDISAKGAYQKEMAGFKLPPIDILDKERGKPTTGDIKADVNIIKRTLENFGIEVEMAEVNVGPTVTQYTLRPAQGVKLSKITALQKDLALALAAHPLRIEAPIPGRSLVGIETPNRSVVIVRMRNLLERDEYQSSGSNLTLALGRDAAGNPVFSDLAKMPHLLLGGATGTGKTIAINNLITSLLYRNFPDELRFIFIDPKRVELTVYDSIPHLLTPVITKPEKAVGALRWAVSEMEQRFETLKEAGKRELESYNKIVESKEEKIPYIVIVIDELADLMSSYGREVEGNIVRLAQMARAVGIHLIVSTQRPSVEVITGLIKANITSRIAFQVASQVDSRTILDSGGAEKLLGNGDMLFLSGNSAYPRRIQGAYISEEEVTKVTKHLKSMKEPQYEEEVLSQPAGSTAAAFGGWDESEGDSEDELYNEAKDVVIQSKKASASLLQRRLKVGYARAARLLDELEEKGVVGPAEGAKPRDVYIEEAKEPPVEEE